MEENGKSYTINIYDNGAKEKYLTDHPPKMVQPPVLTAEQELQAQMAVNIEMLLILKELEGGL